MESKDYNLILQYVEDPEWGEGYHRYEKLIAKDTDNQVYSVSNLTDSPEDAIIARDLVSAEEIVEYIRFGMALAREGYTGVAVEEEEFEW